MRPEHFQLHELVDRATFQSWGEGAWKLLNPDALEAIDGIRKFFAAPVTVNNWRWGGPFQYRGYRGPECPVGAPLSQHRRGNAFDCDVKGVPAAEARRIIMENQDNPCLVKIMRMEDGVNWLHIDCGTPPWGKTRIYLFQP